MTLLATWVGVDNSKFGYRPSAIYITTDSQFSTSIKETFSEGRKTFAMLKHPDIFGYCGDVLFPTIVIGQLIDEADRGLLFKSNCSVEEKASIVFEAIKNAISVYPPSWTAGSFVIVYCTRDVEKVFHCYRISWRTRTEAVIEKLPLPDRSGLVTVEGYRHKEAKQRFESEYNVSKNNNHGTSRTVYHWFTETLEGNTAYQIGKVPQIVALYRNGPARAIGIISNNERFISGRKVTSIENLNFVEWRNELFERYDAVKLKLLEAAQRQPR
ncbi:hypothetical protein [Arcticibacter sp. MXS-1]|uniref:hypothetical protein n=1 Tax=Arcticibacter sp. MXS-1 TaxID=3341726 RepID=UPI0035A89A43